MFWVVIDNHKKQGNNGGPIRCLVIPQAPIYNLRLSKTCPASKFVFTTFRILVMEQVHAESVNKLIARTETWENGITEKEVQTLQVKCGGSKGTCVWILILTLHHLRAKSKTSGILFFSPGCPDHLPMSPGLVSTLRSMPHACLTK